MNGETEEKTGNDMPIPTLKNHIVLVSRQALPSLLGASIPGREPSRIHAVVTPAMRPEGRLLAKALEAHGRKCAFEEHLLANSADQEALYAVLEKIRVACGGESLAINLTGGTKLMALAAAEWAHVCEVPAFYIDTDGEQVIRVGSNWSYAPLPDVLSVRGLLAANGFDMERAETEPVSAQRREALNALLALACGQVGEKALGRLNRLAETAARASLCARDDGPATGTWRDLLAICRAAGTAREGNGHVAFPDEAARRWCNGGWLEEYVRMTLFRLKSAQRIRDFASSVSVRREGVLNELDALFATRNRLFTIECKTSIMSGSGLPLSGQATSALYKLDSLNDRLGGVFARSMLCSVRPLDHRDRERARTMGVRIVSGKELLNLEEKLVTWSKEG